MMLRFDVEDNRFNYRSATVIIHNHHVLLHKSIADDFWALPGGRVEFFETSEDTILREIKEELGLESRVNRLLWHVESFFNHSSKKYHEICNYFLSELVDEPNIDSEIDFLGIEEELDLIFRWIPLNKLSNYVVKPSFLVDGITHLPVTVEYKKINDLILTNT